jgi:AcrR family transcriptional regulator
VSLKAFEKLPEAERDQIIQACMAEFASRGFKNASTNNIVNALGIPKGSLFYWFGSKDNLFLYLVDLSVKCFVKEFANFAHDWPDEILARLRIIVEASLSFLEKNPDYYRLFMSFMDGEARHLLGPYLREHWDEGLNVWSSWYVGVNTSDFCSTPEEIQQLIMWVIAGIKVEMYALLDRRDPAGLARPFFLEKLDTVIRLVAKAIYRHPDRWGYG